MKHFKKILLFLFILTLSTGLLSCKKPIDTPPTNTISTQEEFDIFLNELFLTQVQSNTITLKYSLSRPENYGIEIDEVKIGHFSPEYIKSVLSSYENYLAVLNSFNYNELSKSQQLTFDILHYFLELELSQEDLILYHDVISPTTGIQAQLPVLLAEFKINSKEDLDLYLALVESVYPYFEEVCDFQRTKSQNGLFMNESTANSIIMQCEDFIKDVDSNFLITTINNKISNLDGLTLEEISYYQEANKEIVTNSLIPAYRLLIDTLSQLKSTGNNTKGLYYYEHGKDFYEYLIAYNTNSSKSPNEMIKMIETSIDESISKMGNILSEDPSVYEKIVGLSFELTDPTEIITYLQESILLDFPPISEVNYSVEYLPDSLQDHLSPAMYLVPAIDNYTDNVIYINPKYDLTDIFPTIAHEGYPGHLYQSVYFRSLNPPPIRNLLDFGGYVEGWATYVEYYSYYLAGFDENVADFIVANMETNMGIYCRLDLGIHYEGWMVSDAHNYLDSLGINDKDLTLALYETIVEEPGIYPQYGIGYLEIIELKDKAKSKLGDKFVLKDFHKFILDMGPAPFPIIEDRLDQEIKLLLSKTD
ncbi:MAG: DUF885 domain-containing protein [Clostridiales bacterium]|nr:DUF885 domain-containing protein [Clostridiales bacterium]